jgi:hypothetical protein
MIPLAHNASLVEASIQTEHKVQTFKTDWRLGGTTIPHQGFAAQQQTSVLFIFGVCTCFLLLIGFFLNFEDG